MKIKASDLIKVGIAVVSVGVAFAQSYIEKKDFDEKVTQKVAEVLSKSDVKES